MDTRKFRAESPMSACDMLDWLLAHPPAAVEHTLPLFGYTLTGKSYSKPAYVLQATEAACRRGLVVSPSSGNFYNGGELLFIKKSQYAHERDMFFNTPEETDEVTKPAARPS